MSFGQQPMAADEVHVWYARTDDVTDPATLERLLELLDADERRRHGRFIFDQHRHLYLVAHGLVRTTLSRYANLAPRDWRFECNNYGRPEIANPLPGPPLKFNLSHTRGMAVCAVTWQRDLGVDVEDVERKNLTVAIADRYFSPTEVRDLRSRPELDQHRAFFDYWTLKEAYIKARGMGLSLPLDKFSYRLQATHLPLEARPEAQISFDPEIVDDSSSWRFRQFFLEPRFAVAVAARHNGCAELNVVLNAAGLGNQT